MNDIKCQMREWRRNRRRELTSIREDYAEKIQQVDEELRALDLMDEQDAKFDRVAEERDDLQTENDDLTQQLEQKQAEYDTLCEQKQAEMESMQKQMQTEIDALREELLNIREQNLETDGSLKPMEIHNHFEQGCGAQVFNDKVTGKFAMKTKNKLKLKKKKDKENGRWKKIARKML